MGRLTKDCEIRYSQGADPIAVVRFSIAVNRRFKREGEADADFFECTAFGKIGENINRFFKKGSLIAICGEIRNNNYTDKDGNKHYGTQINVSEFYFTGEKNNTVATDNNTTASKTTGGANYEATEVDEDDLPF